MLNLFVNGISGKMGSSILNQVSKIENVSIIDSIIDCNVVVDFSRPESSMNIIKKCIENKKPIVIGTTGFNDEQIKIIKQASQNIPVLLSYNMSKGIFFLKESIKDFLLKNHHIFECVIHEVHHTEKVDSPSGTAIELEKTIQTNDTNKIISSICVESERVSDVNGVHEVRFFNKNESIVFRHEALSRNIFSDGAIAIAKAILKKEPNLYSVKDFFN
ncbi:MAG: 4-hydroxy-tetrahydrodipicolinate reductase [Proteobacteria bacterium]|jgi:4-hydroxy-tetrahydrodipicolinate reductase|nr:4-hydroxy-tetrahydrodipicolinate reductase [Pseudomonadota bacterium]MDA0949190.1 4-hydroxy-tetrahydrodipicolinate reductase [Pseudomonadota bacterium]MDA1083023.1 4-hydroxy-tetrahydrodipicolinate reductase [Pseudomonadota bacterium]MDC1241434.1 4-hydroxy-tetrahydrodipicolinate reductase [Gammaproteobacteria bacterium]